MDEILKKLIEKESVQDIPAIYIVRVLAAVKEIEELNKVYKAPEGMQEKWDKAHAKYVERAAWIKQMLAM